MQHYWALVFTVILVPTSIRGQPFDNLPDVSSISDTQLVHLLQHTVRWLDVKAKESSDDNLGAYVEQLQQMLQPACIRCMDYFQAVALVRSMGRIIRQLIEEDKNDVFYPSVRRSYVAATWLLQRSKMFKWQRSPLESNTIATMLRLYLHHVKRAQGRTISFHHISKCGGTTMCQLAATNRCSNPHLTVEKNCVLDDRLDSPIWMVSHRVNDTGTFLDNKTGVLDVAATSRVSEEFYNRHEYATEPPTRAMWLFYTCPYQLTGKPYTCQSRKLDVRNTGTTFLAVERTLSSVVTAAGADNDLNRVQVCPEFTNVVTLREPIPHAISLMAEVKFRYVRQLLQKNITSWQPPGWNLTWWETLGPALVGNYATRTLIGRESLCRSAANMGITEFNQAVDALLGFDLVMTLERANDIDLLISNMLGWRARKFSSQPAKRVRTVAQAAVSLVDAPSRRLLIAGSDAVAIGISSSSSGGSAVQQSSMAAAVQQLQELLPTSMERSGSRALLLDNGSALNSKSSTAISADVEGSSTASPEGTREGHAGDESQAEDQDEDVDSFADEADTEEDDFGIGGDVFPLPTEVPAEELEAQAAVALVHTSWLDRQSHLLGFSNITAATAAGVMTHEPTVKILQNKTQNGAHLLLVLHNAKQELWHAYPRHDVALIDADLKRLEQLTQIDAKLYQMSRLMLDLDVAWLRGMMQHPHCRRKVASVSTTRTACGFAGILPNAELAS